MSGHSVVQLVEQSVRSKYFEAVLPALRDLGVDVALVTVQPRGELHAVLEDNGFTAVSLGATRAREYPRAARSLASVVARRFPGSVVHAHEPIAASIASGLRLIRPGTAVLMHRHHIQASGAQAMLSRIATHSSTAVVCVSRASARAAISVDGARRSNVRVAYNGVDEPRRVTAAELEGLRATLDLRPSASVVAVVARLRPVKGVDVLLRSLAEIRGHHSDPHVVVVGSGASEDSLRRLAGELGVADRVRFAGFQSDVAPWLRLADVVAMPSRDEAFPLAALEALACARPFVASAVGGILEMVTHKTSALLVPPADVPALSQALVKVLSSPALAAGLAEGGLRRYRSGFTTAAMASAWVEAYAAVRSSR